MLVLGIETSCDETAAAVVQDGRFICSNVVASQVLVHAKYGGVVPEVASRQHIATIVPTVRAAVAQAGIALGDLDGIAVTRGPGLVGPLLVGVECAKGLAYSLGIPLVGVNHHAGHMAAVFLAPENKPGDTEGLPAVPTYPHGALLVSGGHTALFHMAGHGEARLLGATRDDAAGEAFDKVGKVLGLGYPGGIVIDRLAKCGDPEAFAFPRALKGKDDLDFSFSGLKTALATFVQKHGLPDEKLMPDVCASFQAAVVDVLVRKARRALQLHGLNSLVVCGGVAANDGLRQGLGKAAAQDGFDLFIPPVAFCTDNAAMIAAEGSALLRNRMNQPIEEIFALAVDPGLSIEAEAS